MVLALTITEDPIAKAIHYRPFIEAFNPGTFAMPLLAVTYGALCLILLFLQKRNQALGFKGTFIFFGVFSLLWYIGNLEAAVLPGVTLFDEIIFGAIEVIPLLLLCFLYQSIFGKPDTTRRNPILQKYFLPIVHPMIMACFCLLASRYCTSSIFPKSVLFPLDNSLALTITIIRGCLVGFLFRNL